MSSLPLALVLACALSSPGTGSPGREEPVALTIGVTNHAYFSWVANLVEGTPVRVVPVVPARGDAHGFPLRPEDLSALEELDLLVANDLGHDRFLPSMLEAAGQSDLPQLALHSGVPLLLERTGGARREDGSAADRQRRLPVAFNCHTFLSLSTAIQQIYNLHRQLSTYLPEHAALLRSNARRYAARLRRLKTEAARRLQGSGRVRVATVHDGYAYLLQELGLEVSAVIQPRHGADPTLKELSDVVELLRRRRIQVVFSEQDYPRHYVDLIQRETGVRVFPLSHVSEGAYSAGTFEQVMRHNLETLIEALAPPSSVDSRGS